jgi:hypothetical protein
MQGPLIDTLARQGVTRRTFMKYCATLASMMALPPAAGRAMAEAMAAARRFQTAVGDLVAVPGMYRLHRIHHALAFALDRRG